MSLIGKEEKGLFKVMAGESSISKPKGVNPYMEIVDQASSFEGGSLRKSFNNVLNGPGQTIERMAFEEDPDINSNFSNIYKLKTRLLPDDILKRISIQDDLVAAIVQARASMMSSFGRPQPDRFSTGFKIEPMPGLIESLDDDRKKALQKRIAKAEMTILSCGKTNGWKDDKALGFGEFLFMTARDAVTFGRIAVEVIQSGVGSDKKFHSFRPIDAGTIYFATPFSNEAASVRKAAVNSLGRLKNKRLVPEKFMNDEYAYVQVIHARPRQAFTAEECLVHNFYPTTHIELNGYPIAPLDTIISAVTTHINITSHNKMYFQNGRASRGMFVIKSENVSKEIIGSIRQQFNASINGVGSAFRMPVFGVGTQDDISWIPIDNSSRDMEYQYLSDSNARVILSGFQMSPEELSGYGHLSKGTNSQALSETNTEYQMQAARDTGLRPLIAHFQNFINAKILPLIDEDLSKIATFKMVGLDAETAEKEAARIGAEVNIHLTVDDILAKVEKKPLGEGLGGKMLLNPAWQQTIASYLHVGYIREHMFGIKGAANDPEFAYVRDPFWFQNQQLIQGKQQLEMQQKQMEQQAQQQAQQPQQGAGQEAQGQIASGVDQAAGLLKSEAESKLPLNKKKLIQEQKRVINHFMEGWEQDTSDALEEIKAATKDLLPKKK